jgi:hypothetical protein
LEENAKTAVVLSTGPDGPLLMTVFGGLEVGGVGVGEAGAGEEAPGDEPGVGGGPVGPNAFTPEPGTVTTPASRQSSFLLRSWT